MMNPRTRTALALGGLAAGAAVVALLRMLVDRDPFGTVSLALPEPAYAWVRWTALAVGAIAGSSLAVSGVLLQALLRNPLASPFVLGITAGAGVGVAVAVYFGSLAHSATVPDASAHGFAALLGAVVVLAVVFGLAQRRGWLDPISLILIGVIVSAICGSLIMLLHHLTPAGLFKGHITRWMMGRIPESVAATTLAVFGVLAIGGAVVGVVMGRAMDAATLGDDEARSIGLAIGPLRITMFLLAGALTAGAVALCGPIGFVGLVAPHAARLLLGPRHAALVVGAALAGVILVVGADAARQAIELGAGRLPIGVFTALIGGPAFIWLLRSGKGQA